MSYEIYYDRAFVRVGDGFVPLVNQGSNNTWDLSYSGRYVPEKSWQALNWRDCGKLIFSAEEIREIAKDYERISQESGTCFKTRNRAFQPGELERWILCGMKRAYTVEEYTSFGNRLYLHDYTDSDTKSYPIRTTDELLELIRKMPDGRELNLCFQDERSVLRPTQKRKQRQRVNFAQLDEFHVIRYKSVYFYKWTKHGFQAMPYPSSAMKFESEKKAQKYLDKYKDRFSPVLAEVEKIEAETRPALFSEKSV